MRDQLMKVRIAGEGNGFTQSQGAMPTWKPAGLPSGAMQFREVVVHAAIGDSRKWLGKRSDRDILLLPLPTRGHDPSIFIEQQKGDVRITEIPRQRGRSRLSMQVAGGTALRRNLLHGEDQRQNEDDWFYQGIQRYVTVCWILSFARRIMTCCDSSLLKVRLKLAMFCENNCGSCSVARAPWSSSDVNL